MADVSPSTYGNGSSIDEAIDDLRERTECAIIRLLSPGDTRGWRIYGDGKLVPLPHECPAEDWDELEEILREDSAFISKSEHSFVVFPRFNLIIRDSSLVFTRQN